MTKTDLIDSVVRATDMAKKDATAAVEAVLDSITKSLKKGEKVQLMGFGTFETRRRKAREGVNPATKERIHIAASKVPTFRAGKQLKQAVGK